jgi:hypothetical protein
LRGRFGKKYNSWDLTLTSISSTYSIHDPIPVIGLDFRRSRCHNFVVTLAAESLTDVRPAPHVPELFRVRVSTVEDRPVALVADADLPATIPLLLLQLPGLAV